MSEPRVNAFISSVPDPLQLASARTLIINETNGQTGFYTDIPNDNSWINLFGEGTPLGKSIAAFKKENNVSPLDVISVGPNGGTNATSTITITGTAGSGGTLTITVGSRADNTYSIPISSSDTPTNVATTIVNTLGLDPTCPALPSNVAGVVTLTFKTAGVIGNTCGLEIKNNAPGLTTVITAFSGGTGTPNLAGIFLQVGDIRYRTVTGPAEWGTDYLTDFLDDRFNRQNIILDGVAIVSNSQIQNVTIPELTNLNSQSLTYLWNKPYDLTNYKAPYIFELNCVYAAYVAGVRSLRLTPDADISNIVIGNQPLDQFGGASASGLPYARTPLRFIALSDRDKTITDDEEKAINAVGGSVANNNDSYTNIELHRILTTYKTDANGLKDQNFMFLNSVDCASSFRELMVNELKSDYAQIRLTRGEVKPNVGMVDEKTITANVDRIYKLLGEEPFILVQTSDELLAQFKQKRFVSIENIQEGRVLISMVIVPISQLRTMDIQINVSFNG